MPSAGIIHIYSFDQLKQCLLDWDHGSYSLTKGAIFCFTNTQSNCCLKLWFTQHVTTSNRNNVTSSGLHTCWTLRWISSVQISKVCINVTVKTQSLWTLVNHSLVNRSWQVPDYWFNCWHMWFLWVVTEPCYLADRIRNVRSCICWQIQQYSYHRSVAPDVFHGFSFTITCQSFFSCRCSVTITVICSSCIHDFSDEFFLGHFNLSVTYFGVLDSQVFREWSFQCQIKSQIL